MWETPTNQYGFDIKRVASSLYRVSQFLTTIIVFSQERRERVKPSYNKFVELMERKGVIPADVARETNINQSVFSDWKRGVSAPKIDKLMQLVAYFGVTIEDLLTEEE